MSLGGTASLINQGNIIQAGTSNLALDGYTTLDNQGSYTFLNDGAITSSYRSGNFDAGIVTNSGTITKAGGTGNSFINTVINNYSGTIDVETGTLTLQPQIAHGTYGSFTGGTFDVAAGATLDLTGGSIGNSYYTGTYTGSGAGKISLNSGALAIGQGGATVGPGDATFNFPTGLFQWSGGTIDVSNGSLTNANTGSLTITGDGTQENLYSGNGYVNNALINQGAIVQYGLSNLTVTLAAELRNQGSYTFQGDGSISGGNIQGTVGILTNSGSGTITKAAGTGTSTISCPWANTGGTIDVQSGTISLATPSGVFHTPVANTSTGGTFDVAAGAVLDLTGGATVGLYTGTYTGSGDGTISLNSGTLVIGQGVATFDFPDGLFQWSGGTIDVDNGSLTNAGSLTITGDGTGNATQEELYSANYVNNTLINQGAIVQYGLSNLTLTTVAVLDNQGSYTFQGDGSISLSWGGIFGVGGTFINSGTITKAGGTGTSTISSQLANTGGTINVQTGTVNLATASSYFGRVADYTSTGGTFNVAAKAVLDLSSPVVPFSFQGPGYYTGTYTGSGAGTISLNSGSVAIGNGGATFDFPPGLFQWSGGTINVTNGSLTNAGSLTITGDGSQEYLYGGGSSNALINASQGSIVQDGLSNLTLTVGSAAELQNQGSYTFQGDGTISEGNTQGSLAILTNSGTITKAGGTVTVGSTISCPWANIGGTVDVQTGTISLATPTADYSFVNNISTGGTFNVAANAVLDLTGGVTAGFYTGTYTGSGGGTISLNRGTLVIGNGGATFNFAPGLFQWSDGGTINLSAGSLTNAGSMTVNGIGPAVYTDVSGTLINSGDVIINGTLNRAAYGYGNYTYTQTGGSTLLAGGTLGALSVNLNGGDLSGDGTVAANVNNIAGRVNPGGVGTAGTINIVAVPFGVTGNYTQGASGVLNIDIGGLTAGSEFDQLNVSGTATLDGTLNVGLIQPFLPALGDSFKIMTFSSRSPADSDFATYIGLNLPNGLVFTPVYHDNLTPADLTLTILQAPATPTINTSQQPASATVGTSIADQATVSGGDNPTGTVTFNLYNNSTATGTPLFSDTETLSSGMATSKGYIAAATGTDFWVATYNGDSNNASVTSGTALEPVIISPASPAINTSQQPASATVGTSIADQATVSGGDNPTGTVTFNLYNNSSGSGTPLFTDTEPLSGGTATSAGYTATATGTDYWVATYKGDSNNAAVSSGTALEPVTVTPATPAINTTQQPTSATVGSSIADTATVSGGYNPTGTVTFNLYNNSSGSGTPLFTDTEPLSGGTATSAGYIATATGTDYWVATYNGDSNNASVSSGTSNEPVIISPATPAINTTQQPASATVGTSIADKATVSGGYNPTGTVTFNLYNNSSGTGTSLFTDTETLSGGMATSAGYTATATGTDYWVATYNGDSNNAAVSSGTALEPVTVTPATPTINTTQQPASADHWQLDRRQGHG